MARAELTTAEKVVANDLRALLSMHREAARVTTTDLAVRATLAAIEALRSLPVEQRMEAMGMVAREAVIDGWNEEAWVERGTF